MVKSKFLNHVEASADFAAIRTWCLLRQTFVMRATLAMQTLALTNVIDAISSREFHIRCIAISQVHRSLVARLGLATEVVMTILTGELFNLILIEYLLMKFQLLGLALRIKDFRLHVMHMHRR